MSTFMKNHPTLTLLGLIVLSPFISVVLIVGWVLMHVINALVWVLAWPFKILAGFVGLVLGGGIR